MKWNKVFNLFILGNHLKIKNLEIGIILYLRISMRNKMWLLSGSVLWLTLVYCNGDSDQSSKSFYTAINEQLEQTAVNCSSFIPDSMRELMSKHEPPDDPTGGQMLVEYLLACLHRSLVRMNEASPFALSARPQILYDVVLNQVVSLGFDGTLVTKAGFCFFRLHSVQIHFQLCRVHAGNGYL